MAFFAIVSVLAQRRKSMQLNKISDNAKDLPQPSGQEG